MSLVNDMLRDLESRGDGKAREEKTPYLHPHKRSARAPLLYALMGFAGVLLVGLCALLLWPERDSQTSRLQAEATSPSPAAADSSKRLAMQPPETDTPAAVLQPSPAEPVLQTAQPLTSSVAATNPAYDTERSVQVTTDQAAIDDYLLRARAAFAADQLTLPVNDSAFLYYHKVLSLHTNHPDALQGLEAIAERYRVLAERELERGELTGAQRLLDRAFAVASEHSALDSLQMRLTAALKQPPPESTSTTPEPSNEPASNVAGERTGSDAGSVAPVQLSLASQDAAEVEAARALVASGQAREAERALGHFLRTAASGGRWPLEARRYLQSLYLQQRDWSAARALLVSGLPDAQAAFLRAREHHAKGEYAEALTALEREAGAAASDDEPYRALLASLYQRLERSQEAASHYSRLLDVFGPKAKYWLGLAVAFDQQGEYRSAAAAYRQALMASDATPTIREFSGQRLAQLE